MATSRSTAEEAFPSSPEQQPHSAGSPNAIHAATKRPTGISRNQLRSMDALLRLARRYESNGVKVIFRPEGNEVSFFLQPPAAAASFNSEEATGHTPSSRPRVRPARGQSLHRRSSATAIDRTTSWRDRPLSQSLAEPPDPPPNSISEEKTPALPVTAKEPLNSAPEENTIVQSTSALRDATVAHLAGASGLDLYVVDTALKDAAEDPGEALTLLLKTVDRHDVAQKEVARRMAAEAATAAGWAAKEAQDTALLKVKQAANEVNKAKQMAANKEAKEAKEAQAKVAEEKAQANPAPTPNPTPTLHSTPATSTTRAQQQKQQQHIDSHAQKKKFVGVSVSGQKTREIPKAFRKAPKASADATGSGSSTAT